MTKIYLNIFKENCWKNRNIKNSLCKELINECFKVTKTEAKNIYLNINYVGSNTIKKYNKKYRNKNTDTNVLSFQNGEDKKTGKKFNILFLGEMVLCYEKIMQEAEQYNKHFNSRLLHLFVHSVLHLLGYDHFLDTERNKMEKLEENILKRFGINDLYRY